jgi:hypothetical protein
MASSLPADLVRCIGNYLLATDDLDYYMSMRAVCSGWRTGTDDPKTCPADPRFRLRRWVMLDDESMSHQGEHLFLNTATGRLVRVELPRLHNYCFVTSTGGLLVLASRRPPHVAHVINPFTRASISFAAPIPDLVRNTIAYVHQVGPSPTLTLDDAPLLGTAYSAMPDAKNFAIVEHGLPDKVRTIWGVKSTDGLHRSITAVLPSKMYFHQGCYHVIESSGEMLLVVHRQGPRRGVDVFKVNVESKVVEPVRSIGGRALFLGKRCVSVDSNIFSSIDSNCVFYFSKSDEQDEGMGIYMYNLTNETEEWITSGVVDSSWGIADYTPPSIIQTLMKYCIHTPWVSIGV